MARDLKRAEEEEAARQKRKAEAEQLWKDNKEWARRTRERMRAEREEQDLRDAALVAKWFPAEPPKPAY